MIVSINHIFDYWSRHIKW